MNANISDRLIYGHFGGLGVPWDVDSYPTFGNDN